MDSLAEYVFTLVTNHFRGPVLHWQLVKQAEWEKIGDFSFRRTPPGELAGKTIGVAHDEYQGNPPTRNRAPVLCELRPRPRARRTRLRLLRRCAKTPGPVSVLWFAPWPKVVMSRISYVEPSSSRNTVLSWAVQDQRSVERSAGVYTAISNRRRRRIHVWSAIDRRRWLVFT